MERNYQFIQNDSQELKDFLTSRSIDFIVDDTTGFIGIAIRRSVSELFFIGLMYGEHLEKHK